MSQELTSEQIQQALQGISVPPQPQIMVDLQMEQYMPDPDLGVIARLIAQDPGLSGALLKIVNSAHYGLANKIASIQRAVNLLGSRSIINLINAQSIKGEMSDETIVVLNRFWDTAQDVAMTSLTLAKRIGSQTVDESYALGLFHDCGVPLMLKRFPEYMNVLEEAYAKIQSMAILVRLQRFARHSLAKLRMAEERAVAKAQEQDALREEGRRALAKEEVERILNQDRCVASLLHVMYGPLLFCQL